MTKFCVNCKHSNSWARGKKVEKCNSPKFNEIDLVTGEVTESCCYEQRLYNMSTRCGPEGSGFEQKVTLFGKLKKLFST